MGSEFGGIMIRSEKQLQFAGGVVKGKITLIMGKTNFMNKLLRCISFMMNTYELVSLLSHLNYIYEVVCLDRIFGIIFICLNYLQSESPSHFNQQINQQNQKNHIKRTNKRSCSSINYARNCLTDNLRLYSKGPSTLQGKKPKNLYFPCEIVEIQYYTDNSKCKLDIENFDVFMVSDTPSSNGNFVSSTYLLQGQLMKVVQFVKLEITS